MGRLMGIFVFSYKLSFYDIKRTDSSSPLVFEARKIPTNLTIIHSLLQHLTPVQTLWNC